MNDLRSLPSVDKLIQSQEGRRIDYLYGHLMTVDALRIVLGEIRESYGTVRAIPATEHILQKTRRILESWFQPTIIPVINATGVVLHTNLGRAPLCRAAVAAVQKISLGYNTLEFNLNTGKRGSRLIHAEEILHRLTGAEAAIIVNNNASAVLLCLMAFARRRRVVISRTQLVEIGAGFRIPEVMKQSGARLVEVGATNRVHLSDYEEALQEPTALILRAHHSNFRIIGFTSEPGLNEMVDLGRRYNVPVMDDLGSGALLDTAKFGLGHEPMVQESLTAGVDLLCFSGDKLLGGPQAGIILGSKDKIARIKKHPLARALRTDKMCLAALSATLLHYLKGDAVAEIPIWQMIAANQADIKLRAEQLQKLIGTGDVLPGQSTVGGGSLPEETIPTYTLVLDVPQPDKFLARMRKLNQPIIARVEKDGVLIDPRTVLPEQEKALVDGIRQVLKQAD
ncbi:MAG: L-seryl-tRNA(Sec) selenium transferase [Anaerolineaceae bacterium]|nr:L-seryl-tRNA(Sec) selenium transferase [Anaerolineaceae bacterium]